MTKSSLTLLLLLCLACLSTLPAAASGYHAQSLEALRNYEKGRYWQALFAARDAVEQPEAEQDPAMHMLLAMSYARVGNRHDALKSLDRFDWKRQPVLHIEIEAACAEYTSWDDTDVFCRSMQTLLYRHLVCVPDAKEPAAEKTEDTPVGKVIGTAIKATAALALAVALFILHVVPLSAL